MKKKLIIVLIMILVCSGLFMLAQKAQSSVIAKKNNAETITTSEKSEVKKTSDNKLETNKAGEIAKGENKEQSSTTSASANKPSSNSETGKSISNQTTTKKPVTAAPVTNPSTPEAAVTPTPSKESNFFIIDEVNNKTLLEKNIDFDNVTIDFITCKLLKEAGISYGNDDEGTTTSYFYSIGGLTERKAGPLSGWCFYVNGKKPGMGTGGYIYHRGDVVTWKYKKDAVNN